MANNRPVSYLQTDSRWSKIKYATQYESATIGGSGCGPTAMAMAIATWVDSSVTPVTLCKWSMEHGYKATGSGTYHSYFVPQAKAYGLDCYRVNTTSIQYMTASAAIPYHKEAHKAVDEGHLVICLMGKGNWTRGGHYILWYDNDGDYVLINDPASRKSARERNTFSLLKQQVRFYWVIKVPQEVISMTNSEVKKLIQQEAAKVAAQTLASYFSTRNAADVSSWAKEAWDKAKSIEGIDGKKIFDGSSPSGYITREQTAIVLHRLGLLDEEAIKELK